MRTEINLVLDLVEDLYKPNDSCSTPSKKDYEQAMSALQLVQDAYVEIIQQALKALMNNDETGSHDMLHKQREALTSTLERIADLIEEIAASEQEFLKMIIEYLYTRARLVDELKMFPQLGLELLDRMTFDESLEETIYYMESVMTGKSSLYQNIISHFDTHIS
ncbi:MAG: CII-binding regulator of phage lambda lysogenization HflD [Candidatus Azotimanducaceae bacterium]|jgi:CII-binding regulator of phage lambda lysogenization HflD